MRSRLAALFVLLALFVPWIGSAAEPQVIGHRGAAGLFPENTLAAFAKALALGVDAIEMDVLLTAGGRLAVHHDPRLKPETTRGPDGRWLREKGPAIVTLGLGELKTYDVGRLDPGTRYAGRYPDQRPADGEAIPTLDEVLALVAAEGDGRVQLYIEIKGSPLEPDLTASPEAVTDAVVRMVREAGVAGRTVLLAFDWRALVHARKTAPDIRTSFLSARFRRFDTVRAGHPGPSPWLGGFDVDDFDGSLPRAVHAAGGHVWSPHYRQATAAGVAEAHGLGLGVVVWTVDDSADMRRLIDMGVDGITTNRPDILMKALGRD